MNSLRIAPLLWCLCAPGGMAEGVSFVPFLDWPRLPSRASIGYVCWTPAGKRDGARAQVDGDLRVLTTAVRESRSSPVGWEV